MSAARWYSVPAVVTAVMQQHSNTIADAKAYQAYWHLPACASVMLQVWKPNLIQTMLMCPDAKTSFITAAAAVCSCSVWWRWMRTVKALASYQQISHILRSTDNSSMLQHITQHVCTAVDYSCSKSSTQSSLLRSKEVMLWCATAAEVSVLCTV